MSPVIWILLGAIVGTGAVLRLFHRPDAPTAADTADDKVPESSDEADDSVPDTGCCGQHAVCERDSLIAGIGGEESLYFDDEELDAYRGRDAGDYSETETEQFREVLMTLLPDDVAPWARSITQRGIELPTAVRDELLMIVEDLRQSRSGRG